ncbi:MAG: metal-dependent transcriptional regulator [Spirochaetes bacterium]|nr:metal-dependent transcriptional regulator [Spirochaetota bacterium]
MFEDTDLTANMEDYIETIALLSENSRVVRVKEIAASLNIKMPSVSAALSKLKEKGLIDYEKYGYVELTSVGREIAEKVYSRHKTIADFLTVILNFSADEANDEACKLEHYLSSKSCRQIAKFMKFYKSEQSTDSKWISRMKSIVK